MTRSSTRLAPLPDVLLLLVALAGISACTPVIGDKCVLSTDCSTRGDRLCDTSQPQGYCTQFNCATNSCPDDAACVLFNAGIQGCGYDDRSGGYGSRVARAFCIASCGRDSDCRSGYVCADPRQSPWSGTILDDNQARRTCLAIPGDYDPDGGTGALVSTEPAPVCSAVGPVVGAIDASAAHVSDDASTSPFDAGSDAGADAADALDASDAADAADGG